MDNRIHKPVLLNEVLLLLDPKENDRYLDLTAGYGGHASEVLHRLGNGGSMTLVDRDPDAISYLNRRFAGDGRVAIMQADYKSASKKLVENGEKFNSILADIGVSSPHLDNPDRGFSFMSEGPLDMRMDKSSARTAADIVNAVSKEELADILYLYGELKNSRRIADIIVRRRPYSLTSELAAVIPGSYRQRMKTLAQVFQALRIVVNDELGQLSESLPLWHKLLDREGKLAVITFHSLEDRIVKQYFQEHGADVYGSELKILNKRPFVATREELVFNPRARSAKLRGVQRK